MDVLPVERSDERLVQLIHRPMSDIVASVLNLVQFARDGIGVAIVLRQLQQQPGRRNRLRGGPVERFKEIIFLWN